MTVGELLEVIPQVAVIDVSIRKNGRYCYRWVVGKYIQIHSGYSGEKTPGGERIPRNYALEDGERLDFPDNQFPATFWAIYPTEIGKDVKELEVEDIRITHPFKSYLYKISVNLSDGMQYSYISPATLVVENTGSLGRSRT